MNAFLLPYRPLSQWDGASNLPAHPELLYGVVYGIRLTDLKC